LIEEQSQRLATNFSTNAILFAYSVGEDADSSLAKRALQRVLMKKQLEQMGTELRELMIYQSPPELGALYTEVESMTKEMGAQQKVLMAKQMQIEAAKAKRKADMMRHYQLDIAAGIGFLFVMFAMMGLFIYISYDAQKRWPKLNTSSAREYRTKLELLEIKETQEKLEKRRKQLEREN
jgi:hypothetical protein